MTRSVLALAGCCVLAFANQVHSQNTTYTAETSNNTSTAATFPGWRYPTPSGPYFNLPPSNISHVATRTLMYSGSTTNIYAHFMGWFGEANHQNVGYTSSSPTQVASQVTDALGRGISGFILDWYGPSETMVNDTAFALKAEAQNRNGSFVFAIVEDKGALKSCTDKTSCETNAINDLNYAYTNFETSTAYLKIGGRPVVFFFDPDTYCISCDWTHIKSSVSGNPLFVFNNEGGFTHTGSDGAYSWVFVNNSNPNDWGQSGLDSFYNKALANPTKHAYGSTKKGFNDFNASWCGANGQPCPRLMNQNCGTTWLNTYSDIGNHYSSSNQLENLQLVTWNDYEEGTALETGIDNCVSSLSASITNTTTLNWTIAFSSGGTENTVDHYVLYDSADGDNLTQVDVFPRGARSVNLTTEPIGSGTRYLYIQAVGVPSITNRITAYKSLTYNNNCAPNCGVPGASLSPTSLDFGNQTVNTTSTAKVVTLSSTGTAPLTISSIATSGNYAQTNNCGSSLAAGANCAINVTFTPTATGTRTGTLTVTDNASGSPHTASLTGVGVASGTDLDDVSGWTSCVTSACAGGNGGATTTLTQHVASPAMDADGSAKFFLGGTLGYSNARWTLPVSGISSSANQYSFDFWAYMDSASNNSPQALDFEFSHTIGGTKYFFAHQCDFHGTGKWRVWVGSWQATSISCVIFTPNSWNHFVFNAERTSGGQVHYKNVVINNSTYTFDVYANSTASTPDGASVYLDLDGDSGQHDYSVYFDNMKLVATTTNSMNLDEASGWTSCVTIACAGGNGGATTSLSQFVSSPAMDSNGSAKFHLGGTTGYSNARWTLPVSGIASSSTQYTFDFWAYMDSTSNNSPQALDFEFSHTVSGTKYYFAHQCDFQGTRRWRVWTGSWQTTLLGCAVFTPNSWNHFVFHTDRVGGQVHYKDVVINNTTYTFNVTTSPITGSPDGASVYLDLDGDSSQHDYDVWYDKMNLTATP